MRLFNQCNERFRAYRRTFLFCHVQVMFMLVFMSLPVTIRADSDLWYLVEFEGKRVGYEHLRIESVQGDPNGTVICFRKTQINLKRLGSDFNLSATLRTRQDVRGRLLEFELQRLDDSGIRMQRIGQIDPALRKLTLTELKTGTRTVSTEILPDLPYSPVLETWIWNSVGATQRRATTLVYFPESAGVSAIVSEARAGARIKIGGRREDVQRLNFYPDGYPSRLTTLAFLPDGEVLQQEKRVFGGVLKISRSTPDVALLSSRHAVNIEAQSLIPVSGSLGRTNTPRTLRLRLEVAHGLLDPIPSAPGQTIDHQGAGFAEMTLQIPDPAIAPPNIRGTKDPTALATTVWTPLSDPGLQKMAAIGGGVGASPYETCRNLESHVAKKIRRAAFETSMLPADEVARKLRGDCTEHAVLLAALIRIKGIPARVASGLAPTANGRGFTGHTWVEAQIGGQWYPFDSAARGNRVRIKLVDSVFSDSFRDGIHLFLPVLELVGRARISVLDEKN